MANLSEDPLVLEAEELVKKCHYKQAKEKYLALYESNPDDYRIINGLARVYAIKGRLRDFVRLAVAWLESLEKNEHIDLARVVAESVIKIDPLSLGARLGRLRCIARTESEEYYIQAVISDVSFFIEVGEGERAVNILKTVMAKHPDRMDLAIKLSDVYMQLGDIEECIYQCYSVAKFYEEREDWDKVIELYKRLRIVLPDDLNLCLRLADLYSRIGRYEDAVLEYRSCLRIRYDSRESLLGLARSLEMQSKYSDASLALRKIIAGDPRDAEAYGMLGDVYRAIENNIEAVRAYTNAASLYRDCHDYDDALELLQKILEIDSENGFAIREISNIKDIKSQIEAFSSQDVQNGKDKKEEQDKVELGKGDAEGEEAKEERESVSEPSSEELTEDNDTSELDNELYADNPITDDFFEDNTPSIDIVDIHANLDPDELPVMAILPEDNKVEDNRVEDNRVDGPEGDFKEDSSDTAQEEPEPGEDESSPLFVSVSSSKKSVAGPVASAFSNNSGSNIFSSGSFKAVGISSSRRSKRTSNRGRNEENQS